MSDIYLSVREADGTLSQLSIPTYLNMSLMELLKSNGYPILATCGGIALCATCHIEVLEAIQPLPAPQEAELDMLDQLPALTTHSRLSCQLKLGPELEGLVLRIVG
jgi:2Fe-2S ferredoxin